MEDVKLALTKREAKILLMYIDAAECEHPYYAGGDDWEVYVKIKNFVGLGFCDDQVE